MEEKNNIENNAQSKAGKEARKERKEIQELKAGLEKASAELEQVRGELEASRAENEALKEKAGESKNDYLRLMAEFETFRRRSAEEKLNLVTTASADTIKGLLPVLDDCERALDLLKDSKDEAAIEGTNLIYNKLMSYLKTCGLERIEARGEKFDTDFHEAVAQLPVSDEALKNCVYDVVQTGYTLGGKVIRFAKVVVGV